MSESQIMTTHVISTASQHEELDILRRRLLFRCWHRGTQESDVILGPFVEACIETLNGAQLERLEALLDCAGADPRIAASHGSTSQAAST